MARELYNFGFDGCIHNPALAPFKLHLVEMGCKALFSTGDTPYCTTTSKLWDTPCTTCASKLSVKADFEQVTANFLANPAHIELVNSGADWFHIVGDHEWGGNDWDHTTVRFPAAANQTEVNAYWKQGWLAYEQEQIDNLNQNLKGVRFTTADESCPQVQTAPYDPAAYAPFGFRVGYDLQGNVDNVNPHIEFYLVDFFTGKCPNSQTDDVNKTMIGFAQRAALLARLASTTAKFKVMTLPSPMVGITGGAFGGSVACLTEWQILIDAFKDQSGWTTPGGLTFVGGDIHACIYDIPNDPTQPYFELTSANCSKMTGESWSWDPAGTGTDNTPWSLPPKEGGKWGSNGGGTFYPQYPNDQSQQPGFVTCHVYDDDTIRMCVRDSYTGAVRFDGWISAGAGKGPREMKPVAVGM